MNKISAINIIENIFVLQSFVLQISMIESSLSF